MRMTSSQKSRARMLRRWSTAPNVVLWQELRNRQLGGFKFRRCAPVGPYVVEFVCLEARLVVEITGKAQHRKLLEQRDQSLMQSGFGVIRLTHAQVFNDLDSVLRHILGAARVRVVPG